MLQAKKTLKINSIYTKATILTSFCPKKAIKKEILSNCDIYFVTKPGSTKRQA